MIINRGMLFILIKMIIELTKKEIIDVVISLRTCGWLTKSQKRREVLKVIHSKLTKQYLGKKGK